MKKLTVNGRELELDVRTIGELVAHYGLTPGLVVAEVDGRIVDRAEWDGAELADGMTVELVQFVGGG